MLNKIRQNKLGVTLLEMVVAVAIFSVVILSATKIFQMVTEGQRAAIAAQNLQENMMYAFEVIAKEIRMAQKSVGNECGPQLSGKIYNILGNRLQFQNIHGECVEYQIQDSQLVIQRYPAGIPPGVTGNITPDEIIINNLKFNIVDNVGVVQSAVTMNIDIETVGKDLHKQTMRIQTTISSRYYE